MSLPQTEADLASLRCLDDWARGRLHALLSGRTEPAGRDEAVAAADRSGRTRVALHDAARQPGAGLGTRHCADCAQGDGRRLALRSALIQGMVAGLDADGLNPVLDPEPEHCCVVIPAATP